MTKRLSLGLAMLAVVPAAAMGQQPTMSAVLNRALATDTVVSVWLFARTQISVSRVADVVEQAGGRVRRRSEWLQAVSADLSSDALRVARNHPDVRHIQPVARFAAPAPDPSEPVAAAPPFGSPIEPMYGASAMPLRSLNIFPLAELGLRGQGVKIALLDTGFDTTHPVFVNTIVLAQRDFVFNDGVVRNEPADNAAAHNHGTGTWSLLGGNQPGTMIGIAADAEYILAKTEDIRSETRVEEDNWVAAMEWADSLGAKVISSSLGYIDFDNGFAYAFSELNGDVAVTTRAADMAAERGITVVNSMGNAGPAPRTIGTPADGDSVISVGAVDSLGNLAPFSSRGPTADGRTKPEVTAPGVAVFLAAPSSPSGFARSNGTSFSAPIVAGAAALLTQIHPNFGPVEIRDALRSAGSNARSPDSDRGWGIPDVARAATFPKGIVLTEPADTLIASTTPRFAWNAPDVPAFAQPVRYTLTVARDTTFASPLIDTVVTSTEVQSTRTLTPGAQFFVRIVAQAADSVTFRYQPPTRFRVIGAPEAGPPVTLLFQNFPNPFPDRLTGQMTTCIWFDLATGGRTRLDVLDLRGHVVKNLVPGSFLPAELPPGRYGRPSAAATTGCSPDFTWDGTTNDGSPAPQGVYLIKLDTQEGSVFKRVVFLGRS